MSAVLLEAIRSPVSSGLVMALVGIWVKIFTSGTEVAQFSFTWKDFSTRRQWWRIFTSSFCHSSFFHLLFNVTTWWTYRHLEITYGSMFVLRYTIVLITATKLLSVQLMKFILRRVGHLGAVLVNNSNSLGFSGELFAWVSFNALQSGSNGITGYMMGIIPISGVFSPVFMILITQIIYPRGDPLINLCGMICGFLLGLGLLQILPDIYWSVCFIVNLLLVICWGHFISPHFHNRDGEDGDIFDSLYISPPDPTEEPDEITPFISNQSPEEGTSFTSRYGRSSSNV